MSALRQAVCFLRPTPQNISAMKKHLKSPKFGEYHLCTRSTLPLQTPFLYTCAHWSDARLLPAAAVLSNIVRDSLLQDLADADDGEHIKQVQEYFADYLALDATHFSLQLDNHLRCFMPQTWETQAGLQAPFAVCFAC